MKNRPLKIGIIGCGRVTESFHLPALKQLPNTEVVGLADIDKARLNRVANQFRIERRVTEYSELLSDLSIDCVTVCVPAQFHVEVALAALEAGKHVFVEKPLALTLEDCDRLIEKANSVENKITVGFNLRHHRLIQEAQQIIQEGALGNIEAIRSNWTSAIRFRQEVPEWRNSHESGGGVLFEIGVHHFDLWRFLLQKDIEEVYSLSHSENGTDATATVTAKLSNDIIATSVFSEHTSDDNELEIYGDKGRLRVSLYRYDGLEFFSTATVPHGILNRLKKAAAGIKQFQKGVHVLRNGGDFKMSYLFEWRHFIDAIQNDRPVLCSLVDGKKALEVVLSSIESASTNRPVRIKEIQEKFQSVVN